MSWFHMIFTTVVIILGITDTVYTSQHGTSIINAVTGYDTEIHPLILLVPAYIAGAIFGKMPRKNELR